MTDGVFISRSCDGAVEQFDDMEDLLAGIVEGSAGAKLQEAAGIGGGNGLSARGARVTHFLREQFE
jgi:hypothetical protein